MIIVCDYNLMNRIVSFDTIGGVINVRNVGDIIRIVLMGIFILVCIALSIVVLMQESKQQGLSGTISGAADTYWGRNKGRSMEGKLVLFTKILGVAFFVLAAILNINF